MGILVNAIRCDVANVSPTISTLVIIYKYGLAAPGQFVWRYCRLEFNRFELLSLCNFPGCSDVAVEYIHNLGTM